MIEQRRFIILLTGLFLFIPVVLRGQSFQTNGSAASLGGGCYMLTPNSSGQAGSIFSTNPINLTQPFSLDARMNFGTKDANGADGIVFIFATSNTALGVGGGGLGYQGITPSIAVEYDDYQNGFDPVQDHVAVVSMGSPDHTMITNLEGPNVIPNIEDGEEHCWSVTWDPVTQTLTSVLDEETISYTGDIINTIFSGNSSVYYGFSSGTGSLSNLHTICFGPPVLVPMEDVELCEGESIDLQADENGIAWTWAPHPTLTPLNVSDPTATPIITTTYTVAIDYACDGFHRDTVVVEVHPAPNAIASNDSPLCQGETVHLTSTGGTMYQWSGPMGFTSSQQNPNINNLTPGKTGTYTVTVTDGNGCTSTAETEVNMFDPPFVEIDPVDGPLCEVGEAVQLTASPSNGIWGGDISATGIFDPGDAGEGVHTISYTIEDGNGCTNSAETDIEVVPNVPAEIMPTGPFCAIDTVITLIANPPGGEWGESADSDGQIYPLILNVGSNPVSYMLTGPDECYHTTINIQIVEAPVMTCPDVAPICVNGDELTLTALPPGGTWGGVADATGTIDPSTTGPGQFVATYTYTSPACGNLQCDVDILVVDIPHIQNLNVLCNGTGTAYTVSFDITEADSTGYTVIGSTTGVLTQGQPASFVSSLIPSGSNYSFQIWDAFQCDTILLTGSQNCACSTNAGSMDQTPVVLCEPDTLFVTPSQGVMLDTDDTLVYILHTGDLTMPVIVQDTSVFIFQSPLVTGTTYFISAVVGNPAAGTGVDPNDPCRSITPGPSVLWQPLPDGYLSGPQSVCAGDSIDIEFHLNGAGPWNIQWAVGSETFLLPDVMSPHTERIGSDTTIEVRLISIRYMGSPACLVFPDTGMTIQVSNVVETNRTEVICPGDSIFLENQFQFEPGIYHDTIVTMSGCDSVWHTTLLHFTIDTILTASTSCDPMMTGVFETVLTDQNGCDSLIIETVTYAEADSTFQNGVTCDPDEAGQFIEIFMNAEGCDSLVIRTIMLLSPDTTHIQSTTCDESESGIFTTEWINAQGCDSIVIEQIDLLPSDSISVNATSCMPTDTGTFLLTYQNVYGCDSIVQLEVTLAPSYQTDLTEVTCDPAEAGESIVMLQTILGCDSIITTFTSLLPSDTSYYYALTCDQTEIGTSVITLTNQFGCDSLEYYITSLHHPDTCRIVRDVFVPNVFTPNQDGVNDIFHLFSAADVLDEIMFMRIFDRWGNEVFEHGPSQPNDASAGWNGTFKDKLLNPAVFTWVIGVRYEDGVEDVLYGDVTLLR